MTRLDIILKALNMAEHNLSCYSEDYLSLHPKEGMETQWSEAKREVELLRPMVMELENCAKTGLERKREFTGWIHGWDGVEERGIRAVVKVQFGVDLGGEEWDTDDRFFTIDPTVASAWLIGDESIWARQPGQRSDMRVTVTVDWLGQITSIRWFLDDDDDQGGLSDG